jgi:hypothetical protein
VPTAAPRTAETPTADLFADGRGFFEAVAEIVPSLTDGARLKGSGWSVKVWFDEPREHYEVQWLQGRDVEVGFHSEHRDEARNEAVLAALQANEARWREALGADPVAGTFVGGHPEHWRRLSEVWEEPDLSSVDLAMEAADRLVAYTEALEPLRTAFSRR